jgi:transposase InsO family protein
MTGGAVAAIGGPRKLQPPLGYALRRLGTAMMTSMPVRCRPGGRTEAMQGDGLSSSEREEREIERLADQVEAKWERDRSAYDRDVQEIERLADRVEAEWERNPSAYDRDVQEIERLAVLGHDVGDSGIGRRPPEFVVSNANEVEAFSWSTVTPGSLLLAG